MDREKLQQLSSWMGFVGIITIIGGVFTAIAGLFAFIIGAIPGIITIILGVKLRCAKQYADAMLQENSGEKFPGSFDMFIGDLNTYFKIQGILILASLVLTVLGVIVSAIAFCFYRFQVFQAVGI